MANEQDTGRPEAENAGPRKITQEEWDKMTVQEKFLALTEGRFIHRRTVVIEPVDGYILRKVGQAYMIMPTGPRMQDYQGMITLNETGAFLYEEAKKPDASRESLMEACKREYGASDEEAQEAADRFINQCADCGLLPVELNIFDVAQGKEITEDEYNKLLTELAEALKRDASGANT